MLLLELLMLYPSVVFVVCARRGKSHIEGLEDPHTHPEPPSDKILSDYFVPVMLRIR